VDEYVFGKTQNALVIVRVTSRRRPADVIRPKPFSRVVLIEPDPGDNSLAEANIGRGWPPQVRKEAEVRDYIVISCDKPHPELWALADDLAERRFRKRAGVGRMKCLRDESSTARYIRWMCPAKRGAPTHVSLRLSAIGTMARNVSWPLPDLQRVMHLIHPLPDRSANEGN
jgi:hypothetical protein